MAEELIVGGAGEIVNRLISLGFNEIGLVLGVNDEVRKLPSVQAFREELTLTDEMAAKSSLRELIILECDALKSIPDMRGFASLQTLRIYKCQELEKIPKGLVALESLEVFDCGKLQFIDLFLTRLQTSSMSSNPEMP